MLCPHCGAEVPSRGRTIITGILFVVAALVLLLFVRLPVVVLAAVLLAVTGATMVRGGFKAKVRVCRRCRRAL
jgi:Flp pilus assembly protein TadB